MGRALFVANLDSFHKNFHLPYVRRLQEHGYEVELVSTGKEGFCKFAVKHDIVFGRSPFKWQNITAFRQLRSLLKSKFYDIVYFSTPVIGAVGRLALVGTKHGRVVYSAHGYSFYEGNGKLSNWKYVFIEKLLCRLTDCTFTMNKEDFEACRKFRFPCKEIYNVDGVGVDLSVFAKATAEEKSALRKRYQYGEEDFLLIYPAEFTERKNQSLLIQAMAELKDKYENVKLLLLGRGVKEEAYRQLAKELNVGNEVHFLGYRDDVNQLLKMSDVLFASSINEGLPINMIEALATGLPVVATNTRGQNDLVTDGYNGYLFDLNRPDVACDKICGLIEDKDAYEVMSNNAVESSQKYDIRAVAPQYDKVFGIDENNV